MSCWYTAGGKAERRRTRKLETAGTELQLTHSRFCSAGWHRDRARLSGHQLMAAQTNEHQAGARDGRKWRRR